MKKLLREETRTQGGLGSFFTSRRFRVNLSVQKNSKPLYTGRKVRPTRRLTVFARRARVMSFIHAERHQLQNTAPELERSRLRVARHS